MKESGLSVNSRVWIEGETATFMGEGRYRLLRNITKTGSINEACKRMNMSYKKALRLIETMNSQTNEPLVVSVSGGKGGGGTKVTKAGEKAMKVYSDLCDLNKKYLESVFKDVNNEF